MFQKAQLIKIVKFIVEEKMANQKFGIMSFFKGRTYMLFKSSQIFFMNMTIHRFHIMKPYEVYDIYEFYESYETL